MNQRVIVACEPLREILPRLGPVRGRVLLVDRNLHRSPDLLRQHLQAIVDEHEDAEVVLAMGLCGEAIVGLTSPRGSIVIPRVDDCLALVRGSQEAYRELAWSCPGTYYLTKGWLEAGDAVVTDYERCVRRYGEGKAHRIFQGLLRHYRQVMFIELGLEGEDEALDQAATFASRFGLEMKVVPGDLSLLTDVVNGRANPHIACFGAGQTIKIGDFLSGLSRELRGAGS